MKDTKGAIECFRLAIEKDPNYILAYTNKGQVELETGNGAQALADLHTADQILKTNPDATKGLSDDLIKYI
jgi:tetratricopeptide (TPR) repeat protein